MNSTYVSLFSGAGGLDIGLERAGFFAASLCEIESIVCRTLSRNQGWTHRDGRVYFEGTRILNADIREVRGTDLFTGEDLDLLVGGPPCQAFSSSGKQLSILDPRGALVNEFYRLVSELRPKVFLFENVRGLVTARNSAGEPGGVLLELKSILENLGYSCRVALLNAADFGSYQRRVRCFIVGSRRGAAPQFPAPKFFKNGGILGERWRSLGEFLSSSADATSDNYVLPTPALAAQLDAIPNGSGIKSPGKAEVTRPGGHWGYRQGTFIADLSLPARTVTGSSSQDWVRWGGHLRRLTIEEVKGLQGFPTDWVFEGNRGQVFKQIGNAVPTIFGEIIGNVIAHHIAHFPVTEPVHIDVPSSLKGYIDYTKKDHARNESARSVHLKFLESAL